MDTAIASEHGVAKKKPAARGEVGPATIQISCTRKFAEWVHDLARYDDRQISAIARRAFADYAEKVGFKPPPES